MDVVIKNIADLKLEIARLQGVKTEQEQALKQHFNSPRALLGTITSIFKGKETGSKNTLSLAGNDISAWLSKFLLPLTLNKTLFRKSNFIVKALVGLLSQKAAGVVTDKNVTSLWDKVKSILPDTLINRISLKKRNPLLRLGK